MEAEPVIQKKCYKVVAYLAERRPAFLRANLQVGRQLVVKLMVSHCIRAHIVRVTSGLLSIDIPGELVSCGHAFCG